MTCWWSRFALDFAAFSETERQRIEDLTGCIPLLLQPFFGKKDKSLESLEPGIWDVDVFASVVKSAFVLELRKARMNSLRRKLVVLYSLFDGSLTFWSVRSYVPLMRACLTRSYVLGSEMLDHRYFYTEDGYGRYTCGRASSRSSACMLRKISSLGPSGIWL